ncbi:MAG: ABC transporter permease, partial [Holosporales bacterium]|nr:ABC transporter permease [Holosporales bacterium]
MSRISLTFLIFGYAFLYVPIAFIIISSFSDSEIPGIWTKFSIRWFQEVLKNHDLLDAAITSFKIAAISATCSTILGITAATRSNKFLNKIIVLPIAIPEILIGFSLLMLFISDFIAIPRGVITVIIGHTVLTIGYVYMTVKNSFKNFDKSLEEAAMNLGAKPITVLFRIKLPIMGRTIMSGWLFAFTLSLDDVVIASFLNGPGAT